MGNTTSAARRASTGRRRLVLRLAPSAFVAVAVLGCAHHLSGSGATPVPVTSLPVPVAAAAPATRAGTTAGHPLARPSRVAAAKPVGYDPRVTAGDATVALQAALPAPVDPGTVQPVPTAAIDRAVPGRRRLGPLHVDPMPVGVTLASPTDTASLYARSGAVPMSAAEPGAVGADASVPAGTPSTTGLTQHVKPSCTGTGTDGKRVQPMYVHEASTASRYSAVLSLLRNEVANVDDVFAVSSHKTGGDLRVRWVHDAQCQPVIADVTVPAGSLASFDATIRAVKALGYSSSDRKYLMFADANDLCGIGTLYQVDSAALSNPNNGYAASYARVDTNCWSGGSSVAAHELTHNLGGVQASAPHATSLGHCWDESDRMCYSDGSTSAMKQVCASGQEDLLDCNDDDYFNTHPAAGSYLATHWDTARSSFLDDVSVAAVPPTVRLTASRATAQTGDAVSLTATATGTVGYAWKASAATCTFTGDTTAGATMTCAAPTSGPVTVTVTATDLGTGAAGSASTTVSLSTAAAPTARLAVPSTATAGSSFAASAAATGKAPFSYAWTVTGPCSLSSPTAAAPEVSCTTAGVAALAVVVRQADGQAVIAGPVAVSVGNPLEAPVAPGTATWAAPTRVSGLPVRLEATIRDAGSAAPLAGLPVELQLRPAGSTTWQQAVGGLVTDANGYVVATPDISRAGDFRFAFAGTPAYAPVPSGSVYVKVPTRVTPTLQASRRLVLGRLTGLDGSPVTRATVTLQRRFPGSTRWAVVGRTGTDDHGVARVRMPDRRRSYYRWSYTGDATHDAATSAEVLLRT